MKFEKGLPEAINQRSDNTISKRQKGQENKGPQNTTQKLNIDQLKSHLKPWVNSGASEG